MKILIDTNIVLDVMLKREPFYELSLEILGLAKKDDVEEYVSASAITDIYYLAYRQLRDKGMVKKLMKELLTVVSVASVSEQEIENALSLECNAALYSRRKKHFIFDRINTFTALSFC